MNNQKSCVKVLLQGLLSSFLNLIVKYAVKFSHTDRTDFHAYRRIKNYGICENIYEVFQ